MNKIFLDKLCEFSNTTYNNYPVSKDKDWNISNYIEIIKQNLSLNEKGISNKFNYIDLNWLIPNIDQNELVLIYPLCFNVKEKYEWNYLLNAMLIVLNDDYLYKTNVLKKNIIETFDKTYKKKINFDEKLSDEKIEKIAILTNVSLIILSENKNKIYNKIEVSNQKYLVLYKNNDEYYPLVNWLNKYYTYSDYFIGYIIKFIENSNKIIVEDLNNFKEKIQKSNKSKLIKTEDIKDITKLKNHVSIVENTEQIKTKKLKSDKTEYTNQFYEEFMSVNDNSSLYLSEAIDNNKEIVSSTSKNQDQIKKKIKKNSKDIFVINKDSKNNQIEKQENVKNDNIKQPINDSVFNPTEIKITAAEIDSIKKKLKPSVTLEELQTIAIKLSINITQGANKNGKPKRKTKSELIDEINLHIIN